LELMEVHGRPGLQLDLITIADDLTIDDPAGDNDVALNGKDGAPHDGVAVQVHVASRSLEIEEDLRRVHPNPEDDRGAAAQRHGSGHVDDEGVARAAVQSQRPRRKIDVRDVDDIQAAVAVNRGAVAEGPESLGWRARRGSGSRGACIGVRGRHVHRRLTARDDTSPRDRDGTGRVVVEIPVDNAATRERETATGTGADADVTIDARVAAADGHIDIVRCVNRVVSRQAEAHDATGATGPRGAWPAEGSREDPHELPNAHRHSQSWSGRVVAWWHFSDSEAPLPLACTKPGVYQTQSKSTDVRATARRTRMASSEIRERAALEAETLVRPDGPSQCYADRVHLAGVRVNENRQKWSGRNRGREWMERGASTAAFPRDSGVQTRPTFIASTKSFFTRIA